MQTGFILILTSSDLKLYFKSGTGLRRGDHIRRYDLSIHRSYIVLDDLVTMIRYVRHFLCRAQNEWETLLCEVGNGAEMVGAEESAEVEEATPNPVLRQAAAILGLYS